jgi:nitrate/TMAO reductase-like tetraheme cytochrome c subunit
MNKTAKHPFYQLTFLLCYPLFVMAESDQTLDYERARWHPLHFKPAIETATNEQCLACHPSIIQAQVKTQSPAGVESQNSLAWYQTLSVYVGEQETFHRRHLVTPLAKELMALQCNTCHQGHDPREEAVIPPMSKKTSFTLRKTVNPETTCLKCHGQFNSNLMGLPAPWHEIREIMGDNCLVCHATIRTTRHQVDYLNSEAIEKAGQKNADACYVCHGGLAWYRISYPYPRHPWPGQSKYLPDWAKERER